MVIDTNWIELGFQVATPVAAVAVGWWRVNRTIQNGIRAEVEVTKDAVHDIRADFREFAARQEERVRNIEDKMNTLHCVRHPENCKPC